MTITEAISRLDNVESMKFTEFDVRRELVRYTEDIDNCYQDELRAEKLAFFFREEPSNIEYNWGTYYGPYGLEDVKGPTVEVPSLNDITEQTIEYWENRAHDAQNPIIKARYSGLVWDFKRKITGKKPDIRVCRSHINSLIAIADGDYFTYEHEVFTKLKRALCLAISIKDNELIAKAKSSLILFEGRHKSSRLSSTWGHCFDLLVFNKGANLLEEEEIEIIKNLEAHLKELTDEANTVSREDAFLAIRAATRLGKYYNKKKNIEDKRRVVLAIGSAYKRTFASENSFMNFDSLEQMSSLYKSFNFHQELEECLVEIRANGFKMDDQFVTTVRKYTMPREQFDLIIQTTTEGSSSEIFEKIALEFTPNLEIIKQDLWDTAQQDPVAYFFAGFARQDHEGRVIARIGTLDSDPEGHLIWHTGHTMSYQSVLLRKVLEQSIAQGSISKEEILFFINQSELIEDDRIIFFSYALDAFFKEDHFGFLHVIIPQIEHAIRRILVLKKAPDLREVRGSYYVRTMDDILQDNVVKGVLGEDIAKYFQILFTEDAGWNLRNNVCHGLCLATSFNFAHSDRVLHALLRLCLVRIDK
jgi:hypothetical protein